MMSPDDNKTLVRQFIEDVINCGNLAAMERLLDADLSEDIAQFVGMIHTAFPDLRQSVEELIAEGDKVVLRWTVRGTHQGVYQSSLLGTIPPTGRPIAVSGVDIYQIGDGKIVDEWSSWDNLGLLRQLSRGALGPAASR